MVKKDKIFVCHEQATTRNMSVSYMIFMQLIRKPLKC